MDCPKCSGEMVTKTHDGDISIERCRVCYGLLMEDYMLERMRDEWMAETFLDIGSASLGKKFDKIDNIKCPVCNIKMDKIVDPTQTHIWMESCPKCYRIFLDAGEFTDLKYETLSDKFKSLLKGKRK
ncbi:MAG: hypothetical protein COA96_12120 [SAR86 cluster bacterium]|uniref:Transcription factor zinc-finger domain-containing protein n=1 Tax=SAR86 cluster bacterium TaxID=2030880 RepID=A0A2A5AVM8_9GAMM|nr:MAG: hypothetical protein COA96_12120 [SAR86 cluster bacterium]